MNQDEYRAAIETYSQMHEIAKELGYPSILEALEAVSALSSERDLLRERVEVLEDVLNAFDGKIDGIKPTEYLVLQVPFEWLRKREAALDTGLTGG